MRVLRFLLAVIAVAAAMFAGFFVLAIVAVIGLIALVTHSMRRKPASTDSMPGNQPRPQVDHGRPAKGGEVIDIEATQVADPDRS